MRSGHKLEFDSLDNVEEVLLPQAPASKRGEGGQSSVVRKSKHGSAMFTEVKDPKIVSGSAQCQKPHGLKKPTQRLEPLQESHRATANATEQPSAKGLAGKELGFKKAAKKITFIHALGGEVQDVKAEPKIETREPTTSKPI